MTKKVYIIRSMSDKIRDYPVLKETEKTITAKEAVGCETRFSKQDSDIWSPTYSVAASLTLEGLKEKLEAQLSREIRVFKDKEENYKRLIKECELTIDKL